MILLAIILWLCLSFYDLFTWSLVLQKFYFWFLVPNFDFLPQNLDYGVFIGIMFVASVLKAKDMNVYKDGIIDSGGTLSVQILAPWITLFLGFIVHVW